MRVQLKAKKDFGGRGEEKAPRKDEYKNPGEEREFSGVIGEKRRKKLRNQRGKRRGGAATEDIGNVRPIWRQSAGRGAAAGGDSPICLRKRETTREKSSPASGREKMIPRKETGEGATGVKKNVSLRKQEEWGENYQDLLSKERKGKKRVLPGDEGGGKGPARLLEKMVSGAEIV